MADTRCLQVALRALFGFAQACHVRWNRRSLNEKSLDAHYLVRRPRRRVVCCQRASTAGHPWD